MKTLDTSGKVIRRTYHGGTEDVTFEEFARSAIQDDLVAAEVAFAMLAGRDPYGYFADDDALYEEFTIIDREGLLRDLALTAADR